MIENLKTTRGLLPDQESSRQRERLSEYVSRPLGAGKRTSTFTIRSGDRGRSLGSQLAQSIRTGLARSSSAYRADAAISGTRVGTDNLTGAPLANESGSATLHRGLATGSNVTQIRVPAPEADLPGVPAILTRGSPLLGNRQVLMSFLKNSAFSGEASQGSSINTNSVSLDDECNPGAVNVRFETEDEPDEPPFPPEDQGGSPLEPDEPPPPPVNFNCTSSGCVASPNGFYDTLPECQAYCQQRYSCQNGDCVPDPNGSHANLSLCLNACQSRYTCIDGACVAFPTGGFATLLECVEACNSPRWDCVEGECTLTNSSGAFATATECQESGCNCTPTSWIVTINAIFADLNEPCAPAGNPIPGSGSPYSVASKSQPSLSQPTPHQVGVTLSCNTQGDYAGILGIFPTNDCQIQVTGFSVVPA